MNKENEKNTTSPASSRSGVSGFISFRPQEIKDLKRIRNYFGEHDKTLFNQWAYSWLDNVLIRCGSLPDGYVSPKNDLPNNGESVMVVTDTGRKTIARFETILGNEIWETDYDTEEDEMILGWKSQ